MIAFAVAAAAGAVIVNTSGGSGSSNPPPPNLVVLPGNLPPGSRTFTTAIPPQWNVSMTLPSQGATDYRVTNSQPAMAYNEVLPPPGTIEIQIVDFTPASVAQALGPRAASQSPRQLLRYSFEPRGATDVVRSVAPHGSSLGGLAAAGDSYTYTYKGRSDVQTQMVSRKAGEIVSIQMDNAPSLQANARSMLHTIIAGWKWLNPSAETRTAAPKPPAVAASATGPTPSGQWIATGITDAVVGDVANAHLDQPDVRAWYFTQACTSAATCHTELVDQLIDGTTQQTPLAPIPDNIWWAAVFPATGASCAREPSGPTLRETIRDSIHLGWASPAHRELFADGTETITGCDAPAPSTVSFHWTARPVPRLAAPQITLNANHATTAAAFRSAARRVCTAVNAQAAPFASRIAGAERVLRTATSRTTKATAEASIAKQLAPLVPLSVEEYTQIPQPPAGRLDDLWLRDITENRQQLAPGAVKNAALEAVAIATSRYLRTGSSLQAETAIAESTLYNEDGLQLEGPASVSNAIEQQLQLPAICIDPPAFDSIFAAPTLS